MRFLSTGTAPEMVARFLARRAGSGYLRCMRFAYVLVCLAACSSLKSIPPADHVVRAPISGRANVVLRNLVTEYGSADGRWARNMSPGCAEIWATQFSYRAGVRRDRKDVLAIGRATAKHLSSDIRGLFWHALFGDVDHDDPAIFGFPALLVSGALGGRGIDKTLFSLGLDRLEEYGGEGKLRPRESAGLAALLAEVSRLQPDRREERLAQAREYAEAAGKDPLAFFAWAAVAKASGEEGDTARAREAEGATPYRFDAESGALQPPAEKDEILSIHLAMVHALADLSQASGDPAPRDRAVTLLDYVFSDAYFDGRFLMHDRMFGGRSGDVCSGCNWMALYVVDRLYGDSFVIDPVPALPKRDWPKERRQRGYDHKLVLGAGVEGQPGEAKFTFSPLKPKGRLLFRHATRDVFITCEYRMLPLEELEPRGGMELRWQARGKEAKYGGKHTMRLPFDADGAADMEHYYSFEPLTFTAVFTRGADGKLSAVFRLRERPD
jgi:hypothetical protein